ncbi:Transcription-repair-coupling factor [bioreactor metagenome]|uniref:Transcription-repair-coupling factor n=1 Tax=bioreactor metagenome TaxID=1076179 RepID=A0A644VWD6_9ZZZZ
MKLSETIQPLIAPITETDSFKLLDEKIRSGEKHIIALEGLAGSAASLLTTLLAVSHKRNQVIIAAGRDEAMSVYDDVENLLGAKDLPPSEKPVIFFPTLYRKDHAPGEADSRHLLLRAEALRAINKGRPFCFVTWPAALCTRVPNAGFMQKNSLVLNTGEKVDLDFIEEVLTGYGFTQTDFVCEPGEFALRGGICDVYSFADENPFRITFAGDYTESIRSFDPATQLTIANLSTIQILPDLSQMKNDHDLISVFDLWNDETTVWISDPSAAQRFREECMRLENTTDASPDKLLPAGSWGQNLERFTIIYSCQLPATAANSEKVVFSFSPQPPVNRKFDWLAEDIFSRLSTGWKINILAENAKQIDRLFAILKDIESQKRIGITDRISILKFSLGEGFSDNISKVALYTDHQLFNRYRRSGLHDRFSRPERLSVNDLVNLQPGDYVVHINHGIGRYAGLEKVEVNCQIQEAIRLLYKDSDELLVSIHALHRISKYIGKDGTPPSVDRIGGTSWTTRKNKAKKKVKDIARELISLYAKRRAAKGFAFSPDSYLQHELEASFMYEDTPDQMTATEAIKTDLEAGFPMDRLICGDVGFGKTELAVRAAFKAVADSKQVALLVPTTILAYQHYSTFKERLTELPARVEYMNRFRTNAEQKEVLQKLKEGQVDILIGTHRILSKDVEFKNLGLLIVDEEQKFGVGAKEKLRNLRENIDTLTLTATPIPRTLQFSLMGARDMSVLRTPPPNRYPVQTEVMTFDPEVIRDAVRFEIQRGGQVYFVHNRIQNIQDIANLVRSLVPEARVDIGHGQMPGDEMEKVMLRFVAGEIDVFVSTTIVESGLDVPNANTMILNDAQNFGLSDMHQLRGRVGRSNKKAFCYLFTPPEVILSDESRKRLRAIAEFSDLGSGFQIAMRDLDIRGAGNILGAEQSGFIAEIGFEMYQKILDEAISELKDDEMPDAAGMDQRAPRKYVHDVVIETDASILIPDKYVPSVAERLLLYKELNEIETEEQLGQFVYMLEDRFGAIPREALELISAVRLKWLAKSMAIEKLILKKGLLTLYFISRKESPFFTSPTFQHIIDFTVKNPRRCLMKEQHERLVMKVDNIHSVGAAIEVMGEMSF